MPLELGREVEPLVAEITLELTLASMTLVPLVG